MSISCLNCGNIFSDDRISGTNNRNHCPHCLASLHVDVECGDRKSHCHGIMQAVGLTFKKPKKNRYNQASEGELMLIHRCVKCGKISINRIAADDQAEVILSIYRESLHLPEAFIGELEAMNIHIAGKEKEGRICSQIYGTSFSS